ncbi:MAG: hypothetical protein GX595_19655, partial [Lentisphaerae bacterium]|nr:hypothetical protein [Lentisphaerota bacterium]
MTIRCSHLAAMALALAASPAAGAPSPLGNQPLQRRTATLKALPADFGAFLAADLRKEHSRLVTAAMRRNASMNAGRYDWAKRRVSELQTRLAPWLKATDKALWDLLPSQEMPRDFFVHRTGAGCPACAAPVVYNAWKVDIWKSPWTVSCPSCRTVFPSNDFASYYRSSLDAMGRFRPGAGDPRFLEPRAGAEARWADDGTGVHQGDQRWFFAARCAFVIWQEALRATAELAELYTLTDDPAAAHAAGVLLARTADLYPEMDYTPHARDWDMEASTGGSGLGRIQGCIWECFTVTDLATAYDHVFDALLEDTALAAFVAAQPGTPDRGAVSTPRDVAAMIQRRLIMEGIRGVLDGRVRGNPGMHQTAMAAAA